MRPFPDLTRSRYEEAVVRVVILLALGFPATLTAGQEPTPTFTRDVAPILLNHCAKCHQAGGLASTTSLLTYDAAQARAASIKRVVASREMPPWPADPASSLKFRNDARLSQQDIDKVIAWVDASAPKGKGADMPSIPESENGWVRLKGRNPDLVISLAGDIPLPAEGALPYANVLVKVPFDEDRWVVASQTKPSNPAVVHHMALTEVALPDGMTPSIAEQTARQLGVHSSAFIKPAVVTPTVDARPDMLSIYTPGSTLEAYPDGSAKLLKGGKNMYVAFNIHYQTTGKPESDRSKIALWFAPSPPEHQLFRVNGASETILANGKELLIDAPGAKAEGTHVAIPPIQPFEKNYELIGITAYPQAVTIYQFHPHAHYRGNDFTYTVVYPDGREQTVLSVPHFDHRWQMSYELDTPLKLPAGSKLIVTAHYDNSRTKMHNPAPEKAVYFRAMNQSWDEMFTPFIQYSIDDQDQSKSHSASIAPSKAGTANTERQGIERSIAQIGKVVGCLGKNPAGDWNLDHAGPPARAETQSASSLELSAAKDTPLGSEHYRLLGARVFNPSSRLGEKVAVKGILLGNQGDFSINVTSLQTLTSQCVP